MQRTIRFTMLDCCCAALAAALVLSGWHTAAAQAVEEEAAVEQVEVQAEPLPIQVPAQQKQAVKGALKEVPKAATDEKDPADKNADEPKADQPPPRVETPAAPIDPELIKLNLMDGSMISGKLAIKEIAVETQYGSLNVPISSIRSFTPGLASHPTLAKQVNGWIADLGSANFNDREKAQKGLSKLGPAIRVELENFQNDGDTERRNRVLSLLNEFQELEEADGPASGSDPWSVQQRDVIETVDFTIVGKIVPQSFNVASQYGNLTIQLADIRRAHRDTAKKEDFRQTITITASHFAHKNPLTTTIRVERGDQVLITADGTLQMQPWGNGASSTPEGNPNYGWYMGNQIAIGALVGRVGGNEQFVKVGTKHNMTVEKPGVLQFAIAMQNDYNESQFPGKYTLKIRIVKKQ